MFFAFSELEIVAFITSLKSGFSCFSRQGHADYENFCRFLENAFTDLERGVEPKSDIFWTKTVIFGDFSVLSTDWNAELVREKNRARTRNMTKFTWKRIFAFHHLFSNRKLEKFCAAPSRLGKRCSMCKKMNSFLFEKPKT